VEKSIKHNIERGTNGQGILFTVGKFLLLTIFVTPVGLNFLPVRTVKQHMKHDRLLARYV